jgi:hypothetical protein
MIIALFALAVAMILGGLLAAILGWDIVLVERGWTMVIAGSIMAASGALLLGVTAAVSKLVKIQAELMRLHAGLNEPDAAQLPSSSELSVAALAGGLFAGTAAAKAGEEEQPTLPLFAKDAPANDVEPIRAEERDEVAELPAPPVLGVYPGPEVVLEPEPIPDDDAAEAKVPEFLFAERYREDRYEEETYAPVRPPELDETLYARDPAEEQGSDIVPEEPPEPLHEPVREQASEPAVLIEDDRPVEAIVETKAEPVSAAEEAAAQPDEAPSKTEEPDAVPAEKAADEELGEVERAEVDRADLAIVGTYTSGDNTYVMFSNGSIEAQTPRGVFQFESLDELKAFIASGGESKDDQTA